MSVIRGTHGVKPLKAKGKRIKVRSPSKRMRKLYERCVEKQLELSNTHFMGLGKQVELQRDHLDAIAQRAEARLLNAIHDLEVQR